jgi:hypothetical protein
MRHLLYDGNLGMGVPSSHSLHFADANDAEIEVNRQFLDSIEFMFGPHTTMSIENSANIFLDFITEGRKIRRLEDRNFPPAVSDLGFTLRDLLTRIPIQHWPLPHINHCPCSFCDEVGPPHLIDAHLAVNHPPVYENKSYCSELHLQLASLIGVGLTVRNRNT